MGAVTLAEHHQYLLANSAGGGEGRSDADGCHTRRIWLHRRERRPLRSFLMKRHHAQCRPDWPARVESVGLTYHSHEIGPYWDESACYELTAREVDILEAAANALHFLCIDAAEAVIQNDW